MFTSNREQIARLSLQHALPTMAEDQRLVEAGMSMSSGPSQPAVDRNIANYVDKILRGAKAGDLPIAQPTKFEFAINGKTTKALGLTIPQSLLLRGAEVIQRGSLGRISADRPLSEVANCPYRVDNSHWWLADFGNSGHSRCRAIPL